MKTVRNNGPDRAAAWCIVPLHWQGINHVVPPASAQIDAFEGFETAPPEIENVLTIPSGSLLTFDDQQPNGPLIDALVTVLGMVPA